MFQAGVCDRRTEEVSAGEVRELAQLGDVLQPPIGHAEETHILQIGEFRMVFRERLDRAIIPDIHIKDLAKRVETKVPNQPTEPNRIYAVRESVL